MAGNTHTTVAVHVTGVSKFGTENLIPRHLCEISNGYTFTPKMGLNARPFAHPYCSLLALNELQPNFCVSKLQ
jgi:hypothetical protein